MKSWNRALLAASAAVLCIGASGNWLATIEQTPGGHRMGNPAAQVKLIEFVSYTCNHCASFERQSEATLKLAYVQPGKVSVEVRHLIRDPVDLTIAMLTNCGPQDRFFANHTAFLFQQEEWLGRAIRASAAQQQRWTSGPLPGRFKAVAGDLGLYAIMEGRGYSRSQAEACLNNEAKALEIVDQSEANSTTYKVNGTPSFAINGKLLPNVHSWAGLRSALDSHF